MFIVTTHYYGGHEPKIEYTGDDEVMARIAYARAVERVSTWSDSERPEVTLMLLLKTSLK